jgi:DNA-binding beta-propeller fold protein YncE
MGRTRVIYISLISGIAALIIFLSVGGFIFFSDPHMVNSPKGTSTIPPSSTTTNTQVVSTLITVTAKTMSTPTSTGTPSANATIKATTIPTPLATSAPPQIVGQANKHYEYVFPDGGMYVYDMDNGHQLVKHITLPTSGVRGCVASPTNRMLYLSYGGNGGSHGNGSMLAYNLLTDTIAWTKNYPFGVDSMGISPNGKIIYMPDGSQSFDGNVYMLSGIDGTVMGTLNTTPGASTHNTLVNLSGTHMYTGAVNNNFLFEFDTATNQLIKQIGPLKNGVRPYTINKEETLAFTIASSFLGFEVSSITTGKLLYSVPIQGFTVPASATAPSHGISLSPNEREIYVMDSPNSEVHVFDVSGLPAVAPRQVANIALTSMAGLETPCIYDCQKEGWIEHSRDGRFVYIGDSGDVISTATRQVVAHLPALYNGRKFLEIDWSNNIPVFATNRHGVGYGFV